MKSDKKSQLLRRRTGEGADPKLDHGGLCDRHGAAALPQDALTASASRRRQIVARAAHR